MRLVVVGEPADELDRGAGEGVDVLIIVADSEQVEPAVLVAALAAGQGRDQGVLGGADVLVFVDEDPAEAGQQAVALHIGVLRRQAAPFEQRRGFAENRVEVVVALRLPLGKTGTDQAHGQRVAGEHGDAEGVVADQFAQAVADFQRGMAVVGQRHDGPRVLAADADEVGNAMHQHPRLARSWAGEHQRVGVFPVVGDDGALVGLCQCFDDAFPGLRRGLPFQFIFAAR